jgi:protein-tyrosine phosphatase
MIGLSRLWRREIPFSFSWIISGVVGVGPMPHKSDHWNTLEEAGFQSRFNCCYNDEDKLLPQPTKEWPQERVSLPDHRLQEPLRTERLELAIHSCMMLIDDHKPTYLHCWAGRERSCLIATAVVMELKKVNLYEALTVVRNAHPMANPLYDHLLLLEDYVSRQSNCSPISSPPTG